MKLPAPAFMVAVGFGLCAAAFVSMSTWSGLRTALLPALSVIAAAVLVRLARGLPFANPDHFTLSDFRRTSDKLQENARKLRALMIVCLLAIAGAICFPLATNYIARIYEGLSLRIVDGIFSGVLGFTVAYAFVRILEVIQVDLSLLKLQSKVLEAAIAARNAENFASEAAAAPPGEVAGAKDFGRPLQ